MSLDLGSTATVEIINLITGERVLVGELEYGKPIVVDYDFFNKSNGSAFGIYNIKVYNNNYIYNEKLILDNKRALKYPKNGIELAHNGVYFCNHYERYFSNLRIILYYPAHHWNLRKRKNVVRNIKRESL